MTEYTWVTSSAGPLVLLPRELLGRWGGTDAPRDGSDADPPPPRQPTVSNGSDFDRAHEVEGYAGALPVGDGWGLVFGAEGVSACWLPRADGGVIVCWVYSGRSYAEERALQARSIAGVPEEFPDDTRWEPQGEFYTTSSPLALFCSVDRGDQSNMPLQFRPPRAEVLLPPGRYTVDHAEYLPTEERVVDLIRLRAS